MAKKYPVIGQTYKVRPQGKCKICGGNKSDFRVDVEINYFRGDDFVYKVHKKCFDNTPKNRRLFLLTKPDDGSISCQICFKRLNSRGLPFDKKSILDHENYVHGLKAKDNPRIENYIPKPDMRESSDDDIADDALFMLQGLHGDIF